MLLESKGKRYEECSIEFIKNNDLVKFESNSARNLFKKVINWLYSNGYKFEGDFHSKSNQTRTLFSSEEIKNKIKKSSYNYKDFHNITNTELWIMCATPVKQMYGELFKMLNLHGVDTKSIQTDGLDFTNENDFDVKPFSRFNKFDIESELTKAQSQMDAGVKPFNKFKASQSEEEREFFYGFNKNPFRQAICVLGGSGAGKSTTIENILDEEGHEFEFIIPSASTTGLLSQFSPSKSGYVPSKLGKMILNAYENPRQLFTAVFDECHKSNVIEMINDELLQAISTKRNNGKRFISLDDDTSELYPGTEKYRGNILIPDNLGFIFISSKPDVIIHNDDFFNRIDIVQLKSYEEERLENIEQLLSKRLDNNSKKDLKSNND